MPYDLVQRFRRERGPGVVRAGEGQPVADEFAGRVRGEFAETELAGLERCQDVPGGHEHSVFPAGRDERFDLGRRGGVVRHQQHASALVGHAGQLGAVDGRLLVRRGGQVLVPYAECPQQLGECPGRP